MPNTGTRAAINHLELPVYNIESSNIHHFQQLADHSALVTDRGNSNSWTLDAIIEDEDVFKALEEFCSNASWTSAITFASLAEDELEFNGIYTLLNSSLKQGKEEWGEGQWTLSSKYPRINWIVEGTALTTDWDTLDSVTNGDYTALRNDTTNGGGVSDAGNYIQIVALSELDFGNWWDSTIDFRVLVGFAGNAAGTECRIMWRKCTVASSVNGCYYLECDNSNNLMAMHYIDTAGTDTILYSYSFTMSAGPWYSIRIVAAGHRHDIYFEETTADTPQYRFTVFDDRLTAGREGFYAAGGDNSVFDNVAVYHHKPIMALLPAGAYAWNDIPHQPMTRLTDNCTAYGRGQTMIAPQGNITFAVGQSLANMPKTEGLWIYEGNNATIYDQSGHDRHLTLTGTTLRHEQGVYHYPFSVKQQRENVCYYGWTDTTKSFTARQGYSVHYLCKPLALSSSNQGYCLLLGSSGLDNPAILLGSTTWNWYMTDVNSAATVWDTTIAITYDEWQLITFTFDGYRTVVFYLNGIEQASMTAGADLVFDPINIIYAFGWNSTTYVLEHNSSLLHILSYKQTAADIATYARQIQLLRNDQAAVKIWDTNNENGDWDYLECYFTFDEGFATSMYDLSKYNRSTTTMNWTTKQDDGTDGWSSSSYHKNALYSYHFDGVNNRFYNELGGEGLETHGWTIGGWYKFDALVDAAYLWGIWDNAAVAVTWCGVIYADGHIRTVTDNVTTDGVWDTAAGVLTAGRWYFIVFTWTGDTTAPLLYVNGESVSFNITQAPAGGVYDADLIYWALNFTFDGYMDDQFVFSKILSATRIQWLYQHMPTMIDESQWQQVFCADHQFRGDMIIDNGQIRLSQTFRQIDGNSTYHTKLSPYMWGYSDGHWWIENKAYQLYYANGTADWLETHIPWQITKLDKYSVVIKGRVMSTNEWLQYQIIMSQFPFVIIIEDQTQLQGNINVYMASRYRMDNTAIGSAVAPRFVTPTLQNFGDNYLDATITGTAPSSGGMGLSIGLHREVPLLWLFSDCRYTTSVAAQTYQNQTCFGGFVSDSGIDFDADELPHSWLMGMIPFTPIVITGAPSFWTNETDVSNVWANINPNEGGVVGTVYINSLIPSTMSTVSTYTLPAGSYRAWYLIGSSANTGDATIYCSGASYYNGSTAIINAPAAGQWYSHDLICEATDTITFNVQRDGGAALEQINLGEVVIVPISNSKNFPMDVWLQALRQSRITEMASH